MNILDALNIKDMILKENHVEARMDINSFHDQGYGIVHGGLTITLAETLVGYASNNIIDDNLLAVGQTITASHIKSKNIEGFLKVYGKLKHKGKKTHVWCVEISDENGRLISLVNVTNAIIKKSALEVRGKSEENN